MFRISSITFHNFRNIVDSTISLSDDGFKTDLGGDLIGIYGTNGSSKSSVGYALSLLSKLTCDLSYAFFHEFKNDFGTNDSYMSLSYSFDYEAEGFDYLGLDISFVFRKDNPDDLDEKPYISEETIKIRTKSGRPFVYTVSRGKNYLSHMISPEEAKKIADLFFSTEFVIGAYSVSVQKGCSFFLNFQSLCEIQNALNEKHIKTPTKMNYLASFITHYFRNTSFIMPDSYGLSITNNLFTLFGGDTMNIEFIAKGPNGYFPCLRNILEQIEKVLKTCNEFMSMIIPGFHVDIEKQEIESNDKGEAKYQVRLISKKANGQYPFENESEGIKRLFLISASIFKVMNDPDYILFIDEFDEGIFEVLFGDIVKSIQTQCVGQFVFTSHNLRPLEVMSYTHFIFATVNENNRFVTLKGVKPKNNLRDIFIRKVMYGDEKELAHYVDTSDILGGLIAHA